MALSKVKGVVNYINLPFVKCCHGDGICDCTNFDYTKYLSFISYSNNKLECDNCFEKDENAVVSFCRTCNSFLCEFCVAGHKRMKVFQGHNFLDLSKILRSEINISNFLPVKKCQVCKNEFKNICFICKTFFCVRCTNGDHVNHKGSTTEEFEYLVNTVFRNAMKIIKILEKSNADGYNLVSSLQSRVNNNAMCPRSVLARLLCHLLENPMSGYPVNEVPAYNVVIENFNQVMQVIPHFETEVREIAARDQIFVARPRAFVIAENGYSDDVHSFELFGDGPVQQASHQKTPEREYRDFQQDIAFNLEVDDYISIHEP